MNSPLDINDYEHSEDLGDRDWAINEDQKNTQEGLVSDNPSKNSSSNENSNGTPEYKSKKKYLIETDDSFEVFLPLKPKNNNKKKCLPSPVKLKKKNPSSSKIRPYFSTRKSPSRAKEDRDLQLALARSLADVSHNEPLENISDIQEKKEKKSVFLKKFASCSKKPGTNSLLCRRTNAERQSILTQKVAIILIQSNIENVDDYKKEEVILLSSVLEGNWDKNSTLWERSKVQLNNIYDFYVHALEKFIEVPNVNHSTPNDSLFEEENGAGDISKNMEIKNCMKSCKKYKQMEDYNEETCQEFPKDLDSPISKNISNGDFFNQTSYIDKEKYIADSLSLLSDNFLSILENSGNLGDVRVILKTAETLTYHSFILNIRCPSVLFSSESSNLSNTLDFSQYSVEATKAFFKYLYSGKIEFIYNLSGEDKNDLLVLAKKYNVDFLEQFILSAFHSESFHIYSQSTCSPPHSSGKNTQDFIKEEDSENLRQGAPESLSLPSFQDGLNDSKKEKKNMEMVCHDLGNDEQLSNSCNLKNYKSSEENSTFLIDENTSYDLFKDDIKSSGNSSVLSQSESQTKRKLHYSFLTNEPKKLCSEKVQGTSINSPEIIITLDSDSNDECFSSGNKNDLSFAAMESNINTEENVKYPVNNSILGIDSKINGCPEIESKSLDSHHSKSSFQEFESSSVISEKKIKKDENSFDKYFEASFTSMGEFIDKIEQSSQPSVSPTAAKTPVQKKISLKVLTPLQKIIIDKATPKPDFKALSCADLKVELKKYGIKPDLDREKALSILFYVYEQTHPLKTDVPGYISPIPSTSKRSNSPIVISDEESDLSYMKNKRMKSETDFAYEEYFFNQSMERDETFTNQNKKSLKQTLTSFLRSDMDLLSGVLCLNPLSMKKFYKTAKEHGIQCSEYELMDVLDDLCVNYQVEKNQPKQKNPVKKSGRRQKKRPK